MSGFCLAGGADLRHFQLKGFSPAKQLLRNILIQLCSEQFSERAYTHGEMEEMLGKAGLTIEAVYDDLSFSPPGETSQREIFVVRKKENGK